MSFMNIIQSASKIVFILMTLGVIAGLFFGKVDPKDFMVLASIVFTYYFTNNQSIKTVDPTVPTSPTVPPNSILK